ncbi:PadR family transcriptional regulator [Neobacillus mesonae]|nr:PadR family transcriptional regulator [Neobacillus mesonae]
MIKGYIDAIILSILDTQDAYGYEISKIVNRKTNGQLSLKEGTLYPALKRMEANNYILSYWRESESSPRRKYYQITTHGRAQLHFMKSSWIDNMKLINIFLGGKPYGSNPSLLTKSFPI